MKNREHEIGKRYGSRVVIGILTREEIRMLSLRPYETYARCRCDCGNESNVVLWNLHNGRCIVCRACSKKERKARLQEGKDMKRRGEYRPRKLSEQERLTIEAEKRYKAMLERGWNDIRATIARKDNAMLNELRGKRYG